MKFVKLYWDTLLLLVLVWCILNEDFSSKSLISGIIASILTIIIMHVLFSNNARVTSYHIQPYLFVWLIFTLLFHIVLSSFTTIRCILNHNINPTVVNIETKVHNPWYQCLIANCITLTPGTVTIDKTDHKLQVLWLYPTSDDPKTQAQLILGPFEHILKKGDDRR
jgi:multicomponent Na+:H+ antiporter subunit E